MKAKENRLQFMLICEVCGSDVSDLEEKCPTCGKYAGPPNVRAATQVEETQALEKRYQEAYEHSRNNDSEQALREFDATMQTTCAVINVDIDVLRQFLIRDNPLYSNYDLSVEAQTRRPAEGKHDRERKTIGSILFGNYAKEIRYAALSLDGSGLKSYGPYAIRLRDIAIRERATVLEENSYKFVSRNKIEPGEDIPRGCMARWQDRNKLAVAKLADRISAGTRDQEHSKILLFSEGDRDTDSFIEVHIYGAFDNKAIESVKGSSHIRDRYERAAISSIKDLLKKAGKNWIEE